MQRVLAVVIAALLAAGGISALRVSDRTGGEGATGGQAGSTLDAGDGGSGGERRPGPGQVRVTGTVTDLVVENAALAPLPFPLTLQATERGVGRATIQPATIDGRPGAVVVWDSGTPLPIDGPGALDLDGPALVVVTDGQLRVGLDGPARAFPPGTFRLGATVAVGRSGLAQPRDGVQLATDGTLLQTTGGVFIALTGPLRVEGPSALTVRGPLMMERPDGEVVDIHGLDLRGGPLVAQLTPTGEGWHIDALLQGSVVAVS